MPCRVFLVDFLSRLFHLLLTVLRRFPSKNYALSEVNIRFTRGQNASIARIYVRASAASFFSFFFSFVRCFRVSVPFARVRVSAFTREQAGSPREVIEDFGP